MNINQREIKLQQWVYVGGPGASRTFAIANLLVLRNRENFVTRILGGLQYMISLCLYSGADLKMIDQDDCTALHMCCCRGHRPVAELLLKHQAPAFTKNKSDLTPLDLAVKEGHRSVSYFAVPCPVFRINFQCMIMEL